LLLEVGGEGGSIQLHQISGYFVFTTDETTLKEFVPEMTLDELKSKSDAFRSFAEAMKCLLEKYPIFNLYPLTVHPYYKQKIIPYYLGFCSGTKYKENRGKGEWDRFLLQDKDSINEE